MNEEFLQFLWQYQYFNMSELSTVEMEKVEVIDPGMLNRHQGPDFLDAKVRINGTLWCGPVEVHVRSGDWRLHGHDSDRMYDNVILHVVWEHDVTMTRSIPVLELSGRVPRLMEQTFMSWLRNLKRIPCEDEMVRHAMSPSRDWLYKLMVERLERKSDEITGWLSSSGGDWETIFWWQLARSFGHHVNAEAFEEMARSVPLQILARHRSSIQQLEALLLGQCGLLEVKPTEPYVSLLHREYRFLKQKYGLHPVKIPVKFLRMRPHNFPTVRLAQLSMLIHQIDRPFATLLGQEDLRSAIRLMTVTANDFWHYHYRLDKPSAYLEKTLGQSMIGNVVINTIVPFLYAYARAFNLQNVRKRAIRWLHEVEPEQNASIRVFLETGLRPESAADTQALLQLEREYCSRKRCLECEIGLKIISGGRRHDVAVSLERALNGT